MCPFLADFWLNRFPQTLHSNGFSPVWINICRDRDVRRVKNFKHTGHCFLLMTASGVYGYSEKENIELTAILFAMFVISVIFANEPSAPKCLCLFPFDKKPLFKLHYILYLLHVFNGKFQKWWQWTMDGIKVSWCWESRLEILILSNQGMKSRFCRTAQFITYVCPLWYCNIRKKGLDKQISLTLNGQVFTTRFTYGTPCE